MNKIVTAAIAFAAFVLPAKAHFVWILPTDSPNTVQVVFGEGEGPDEYVPVTKIKQTRLYAFGAKKKTLTMRKAKTNAFLVTLPQGTNSVAGECVYGVLSKGKKTFRLVYHPKMVSRMELASRTLHAKGKKPRRASSTMEIVAELKTTGLGGKVLFNGSPITDSEVVVRRPRSDDSITVTTDKAGVFQCKVPSGKGPVLIRARHIDQTAGTLGDKKYPETRHYATLFVPVKAAIKATTKTDGTPKEDPRATKLLKVAREARAVWNDFPGFTANLEINHNGTIYKTPVTITSQGRVKTELNDESLQQWVRRQVGSIASHRLSNAADYDTPCAFADDNRKHPLGRRILILNDELHSSYRIRDRQIIEVFRSTGPIRFKITVLKNYRNKEKKFLPASYVVNSWNAKTNKLVSSTAFHDTWKRVGKFDLPATMTVVGATSLRSQTVGAISTEDGPDAPRYLDVKTLRFSKHKLLTK
ncbi:MAG: DUF3386 family protein [Gemmataceae bacterium]